MLILKEEDLKKVLSMGEVIEAIEQAFIELAKGSAHAPLRTIISISKHSGTMLYMPCYLEACEALSVKIVSVFEKNPDLGLPTIFAMVILHDSKTGEPLALMNGEYITGIRTGAATGVAVKYLSRADSKTLGIIGTGFQAEFQLWAVNEVRKIKKVFLYNKSIEKAEKFAKTMKSRFDLDFIVEKKPEKVVKNSDILILSTTSKIPVIRGEWIKDGTFIASIGWMGKKAREIDSLTVKKSKLVVDLKEAVLKESGDIIIPLKEGIINENHIFAELSEVILSPEKRRKNPEEIFLFKSVGVAIEDAVTAKLAFEKAVKRGRGLKIEL